MAPRLYGQYGVEDVLLARFPDEATHIKRLAQLLPEAELSSVAGAAARLCRWHHLLDRVAPGTYCINGAGRARRAQLHAARRPRPQGPT